jgi:hypothetical protein
MKKETKKVLLGFVTTSFILLVMIAPTTTATASLQQEDNATIDEPNIPIGPAEEEPEAAEDQTPSSPTLPTSPDDKENATQEEEIEPTKEEDGLTHVEITGVLNIIFDATPRYILAEDNGTYFTLDLDEELIEKAGGSLKLNNRVVNVTGTLDSATNNTINVLTIELVVGEGDLASQGSVQEETAVEGLNGVVNVIWSSKLPNSKGHHLQATEPVYILAAKNGTYFTLDLDESQVKKLGGPLKLNKKAVKVTGTLEFKPDNVTAPVIETQSISAEQPTGADSIVRSVSGTYKWAVILCRFGDAINVTPQPPTYFENEMKFMDNYWQELSFDKINLAGSQVFGWYNLPQPRSTYVWGSGVDFDRLTFDCTKAADADINFPDYEGVILAFNQDLDCCAYGGSRTLNMDGVTKPYGITWMPTWGWANANVMGHETGHGFGLPHSVGPYGPTSGSRWDIMSDGYNRQPPDPNFGYVGVHTISFYKYFLGWIPDHRRYLATAGPDQSVYIEPLEQFGGNYGYLMAQIPIGGSSTKFYTIEARKWIGFDVGLPGEAIIIHEVDTTREEPAWVVDVDVIPNSDPNDEGAMWTTGEIFRDTANNISVAIAEESANGYKIIVNPTNQNQPPKANDQSVTINKNTPATITLTASDPDGGDALTYSIVTNPSEGSLSSFNPSTGTVRYTPDRNYVGLDSFTFKVIDSTGSDSNTATVTIVVNDDDYPETWINSVRTPDGTDIPNGGSTTSKVVTVDFQSTATDTGKGSHVDLKIDNGRYKAVASPKTIPGLSVGKHTISLKGVDKYGNEDPTPAKWTFTVIKVIDELPKS